MIENEYQYIKINHPELQQQLQHILEHPGDPLYNSLIIRGDIFSASCAFKNLEQALQEKYPGKEILYHDKNSFSHFIEKSEQLYLDNFCKIHPNLICFIVENLTIRNFTKKGQDKIALFLKNLTKQNVQVLISTQVFVERYGRNSLDITPEIYSLFRSGRENYLEYGFTYFNNPLKGFITLAEDKKRCELTKRRENSHHFGDLYLGILAEEGAPVYEENIKVSIGFYPYASGSLHAYKFPKVICPTCGKATMIPYNCVGSLFSGGFFIKFACLNCKELAATNGLIEYRNIIKSILCMEKY